MNNHDHEFPCPAWGFLVFDEPAGCHALYPVCDWFRMAGIKACSSQVCLSAETSSLRD
jgi:hypothetical protein